MTTANTVQFKKASATDWTSLINLIYPVGAYYISNEPTSPATLFGGVWSKIIGKFLYCNEGIEEGGSNNAVVIQHNHVVDQQPTFNIEGNINNHNHTFNLKAASHTHTFSGSSTAHKHTHDHDHNTPAFQTTGATKFFPAAQAEYGWKEGGNLTSTGTGFLYPAVKKGNVYGWYDNLISSLGNTFDSDEWQYYTGNATVTVSGSNSASGALNVTGTIDNTQLTFTGSAIRENDVSIASEGVSGINKNMPAYRTVYAWRRVS